MLAQLGYEKLDDIIGQTNLLRPRDISLVKTQHLDLSYLLSVCGLIIYYFPVHMSYSWQNFFFFLWYFLFYSRMSGYQNGAVPQSGTKMFTLMDLFWMMFY